LQSLNMRSARCLILSHQVHLQSQIHCWIGRSPHHQTTPLERGRVPNMHLNADKGTTITLEIRAQSPLDVCWNLETNYFGKRSNFSRSYLSVRKFADWNSLRYQSVHLILQRSVHSVFSKTLFFHFFSLRSLPVSSLHISCIRKLSPW
jgi:hypothetical protein